MYPFTEERSRTMLERDVAAQPGYVRLALATGDAGALAACRKFSKLCAEESANRALVIAQSSGSNRLEIENQIRVATGGLLRGFKLAVVAQGSDATSVARIAEATAIRQNGKAKVFHSEHQAAAWLLRR